VPDAASADRSATPASVTTGFALAVDIGGTFTDVVLRHRDGARLHGQDPHHPWRPAGGFFRAVDLALGRAGIGPAAVDDVTVHATTLVTNAVIERRGPPTALVTTEGFRDVLRIRSEHRYDMFDPQIEYPEPLSPPPSPSASPSAPSPRTITKPVIPARPLPSRATSPRAA
jgi:N-methylhydantoinase A